MHSNLQQHAAQQGLNSHTTTAGSQASVLHGTARATERTKHLQSLGHHVYHYMHQQTRWFTCSKCTHLWRKKTDIFNAATCPGPRQPPKHPSGNRLQHWRQLPHHIQPQLAKLWSITKQQQAISRAKKPPRTSRPGPRRQWVRDLVEEGIEANPGPSPTWTTLNCQGANNCFRFLQQLTRNSADLICLQETNFTPRQAEDATRIAMRHGYRAWAALASVQHDARQRPYVHGLFTLVKRNFPAAAVNDAHFDHTATQLIHVRRFYLLNCYKSHYTTWPDFEDLPPPTSSPHRRLQPRTNHHYHCAHTTCPTTTNQSLPDGTPTHALTTP